ncbi:hypothetical protein P691DRAFT_698073 [Macrolepiota fuliginosa MF-IS2]|uniref:Uncharacterized protein n=1 Tax=Macrolepiota fuliginosa MF-IS2 TaxID=1400762 RepID=A0A9P5XKG8_9AGAR|nr:hypothetical protein P691DRAFT_698073 [Macrolepiota fuliginosa MF-IS2]
MISARSFLRPRAILQRRCYATDSPRSRHAQWYSDMVPSMIPVFLLGSAIYLGLELTQLKLAHEKYMDESATRIQELEAEIAGLREKRLNRAQVPTIPPTLEQAPSKKRSWW